MFSLGDHVDIASEGHSETSDGFRLTLLCVVGASVLDRYGMALFNFFTHLANTHSPMYWNHDKSKSITTLVDAR